MKIKRAVFIGLVLGVVLMFPSIFSFKNPAKIKSGKPPPPAAETASHLPAPPPPVQFHDPVELPELSGTIRDGNRKMIPLTARFSPDSRRLAVAALSTTGSSQGVPEVFIYDCSDFSLLQTIELTRFQEDQPLIRSIAFSNSGETVYLFDNQYKSQPATQRNNRKSSAEIVVYICEIGSLKPYRRKTLKFSKDGSFYRQDILVILNTLNDSIKNELGIVQDVVSMRDFTANDLKNKTTFKSQNKNSLSVDTENKRISCYDSRQDSMYSKTVRGDFDAPVSLSPDGRVATYVDIFTKNKNKKPYGRQYKSVTETTLQYIDFSRNSTYRLCEIKTLGKHDLHRFEDIGDHYAHSAFSDNGSFFFLHNSDRSVVYKCSGLTGIFDPENPPVLEAGYLFSDSNSLLPNNALDPGEKAEIKVRIKNTGSGDAYDITGQISTQYPGIKIKREETLCDILYSGKTAFVTIPLEADIGIEPGTAVLNIKTTEKYHNDANDFTLSFDVTPVEAPALTIENLKVTDGLSGSSSGNVNGIIENGEKVILAFTVLNKNRGDALNVTLNKLELPAGLTYSPVIDKIDRIGFGAKTEFKILIEIPRTFNTGDFPVRIKVQDYRKVFSAEKEFHPPFNFLEPDLWCQVRLEDSNHDGFLEPNEVIEFQVQPKNTGRLPAENVKVKLSIGHPQVILRGESVKDVNTVIPFEETNPLIFTALIQGAAPGGAMPATVTLSQNGFEDISRTFDFEITRNPPAESHSRWIQPITGPDNSIIVSDTLFGQTGEGFWLLGENTPPALAKEYALKEAQIDMAGKAATRVISQSLYQNHRLTSDYILTDVDGYTINYTIIEGPVLVDRAEGTGYYLKIKGGVVRQIELRIP